MSDSVPVRAAHFVGECSFISQRSFLSFAEVWGELPLSLWVLFFYSSAGERIGSRRIRGRFWLVEKRVLYLWVFFFISSKCICGAYLHSDVFYSFYSLVTVQTTSNLWDLFSTKMYTHWIFFPSVLIYLFVLLLVSRFEMYKL